MQIRLNYKYLRFIKLLLVIGTATGLFTTGYWLLVMFYPQFDSWIIIGLFIVSNGLTTVVMDSGDDSIKKWYEAELISAQELFATLYDQSPVPYLTLNNAGKIALGNKAVAHLFKNDLKNIIGKKITDLVTHESDEQLSLILGMFQAGGSMPKREVQIITSDKEKIWVDISIFHSIRLDQRLVSMVDINTLKIIDKAKSEFVALATHQLRTPITAIKWNLDLLAKSATDSLAENQTNYLTTARRNVVRMTLLINDFLNVSKLETGSFATTITEVQLDTYLKTVLDEFQQSITEKLITIKTAFNPSKLKIKTDENLFHIITSNVISNAVKYTKPNTEILIQYTVEDNNHFRLIIADAGIGIPAHELDNLFKKFWRASNAQLVRAEGTGLGMYIVKESIQKLGGTINVETTENVGTKFIITLPIRQTLLTSKEF